jgi:hypothetical protein
MERLLFKKIELWIVGLLTAVGIVALVAFGNVVVHTMKGGTKAGIVGKVALAVSDVPGFLRRLDPDNYFMVAEGTHDGISGFRYSYAPGTSSDAGYLVLSRYDGDRERPVVELVDLNAQEVIHRWAPDTDGIFARSTLVGPNVNLPRDRSLARMLFRHPLITEDGGMIAKNGTPLFKVDACGGFVWMNDTYPFHHTLETDGEGMIWTAARLLPTSVAKVPPQKFLDDGVVAVDQNGKITYSRSVSQIFLHHELPHLVYGGSHAVGFDPDPIHLNDVQPVLEDGPHWKKGDLFLSMRSPSMLMLYRPSTDEILWKKAGPWIHQHDVDILDDHRISVFNNNSAELDRRQGPLGNVEVMVYDFATDKTTSPWRDALQKLDVVSLTEGLAEVLPDNGLFVEEQNRGRLLRIRQDGSVVWEYVNRAEMGRVFRVGWSRLLDKEAGDRLAETLSAAQCQNQRGAN